MAPTLPDSLHVALLVFGNVVSVVGVVAFNKMLYQPPHDFKFASTLMCFHFFCTWLFVLLSKKMGWFTEKKIEESNYVKLGFWQSASVGFVNLSLLYNSVGMYQVLKFSNVLVICCIEYIWKHKSYSTSIYISLVCLVVGISVSTVTQIDIKWIGIFHGIMGSVSTAVYQISNKSIQTDFDVKGLQLLQFEQPYTAGFAFLFAMLTDDIFQLVHYKFTPYVCFLLVMSGVFAFGVNVTCYLIIGKTSPVTYGVVGHTKTVFILLFGFVYMREAVTMKGMMGLLVAFVSIVAYTHFSTNAPKVKTETQKETQNSSAGAAGTNIHTIEMSQIADDHEEKAHLIHQRGGVPKVESKEFEMDKKHSRQGSNTN